MKGKLYSLQIIRAVASILVVVHHLGEGDAYLAYNNISFFGAAFGVDLFFVLSGFIMCLTLKDFNTDKLEAAKNFILRRVLRIYPIYIILGILYAPINIMLHGHDTLSTYISVFLLLPSFTRNPNYSLGPAWTLCYEMLFYMIFTGSILLFHQKNKIIAFASIFIIALVSLSVYFNISDGFTHLLYFNYVISNPLFIDFVLGIVAYSIYSIARDKISINLNYALITLLAYLSIRLFINIPPQPRLIEYGIPAFLFILLFILTKTKEGFGWNKIYYIGDASYSIYLIHGFFIPIGSFLKRHVFTTVNPSLISLLMMIAAIVTGCLFYSFVESAISKKMNGWLNARMKKQTNLA